MTMMMMTTTTTVVVLVVVVITATVAVVVVAHHTSLVSEDRAHCALHRRCSSHHDECHYCHQLEPVIGTHIGVVATVFVSIVHHD